MNNKLIILFFFSAIMFLTSVLMAEKNSLKAVDLVRSLETTYRAEKANLPAALQEWKNPAQAACDLAAYGMDCDIARYLEKNLAWNVNNGSCFCSYDELGVSKNGENRFLYAVCEEFYAKQGKIYAGSGFSSPVKLIIFDGVISHWVPRDGSYFSNDTRLMFPEDLREKALDNENQEVLAKINILRAERYFNATVEYSVEKLLDNDCAESIDCLTPGEYLARSDCRFTTRCIDGKCAVVCPNYYFSGV